MFTFMKIKLECLQDGYTFTLNIFNKKNFFIMKIVLEIKNRGKNYEKK